ncbi:uncharacterized protein TNCV_1391481 [Trichonephila clavipes]|nr:uncharacterized protein TNCV_1391481 [Trichonephila clavipes]
MGFKLKAWLKAKLGFGGSSIPYKEFEDEPESTFEEVKSESMITFDCAYCDYRSPTPKGLRWHRLTVHKIGVGEKIYENKEVRRRSSLHLYSQDAVWTKPVRDCCGHDVTSASICIACHVSGCLDYKFSHISH